MSRLSFVCACACALSLLGIGCATPTSGRRSLRLEEARAVVASFEATLVPPQHEVHLEPGKAGALLALKSDRLDAFPAAVAQLADDDGADIEALALRAQLYLAWGEAELTVAEVLARTALSLETTVRALEVRRSASPEDQAMLQRARERIAHAREVDEALRILAAEHVDQGHREAEVVIDLAPDNYLGYRVAADAARLRHQWKRFGELLTRIEAHYPESNGLRFLRGVASWMRDGDATAAAAQLNGALRADPEFVRAQAQLVLVAPTILEQHDALAVLKQRSPDHQLVRWAGPDIEAAWQAATERQKQIDAAMGIGPTSSAAPSLSTRDVSGS
jgi:hypothetical protein